MWSHFKTYLHETTIHGCHHLVKETNRSFAFAWFLVIAVSFAISGWLIADSLVYTNHNPVATTSDFVSIQEIPFPAVTVLAHDVLDPLNPRMSQELHNDLLHQLEFDCALEHSDQELEECLENSAALRAVLRPNILGFINGIYGRYLTLLSAESASSVLADFFESERACVFLAPKDSRILEFFRDVNATKLLQFIDTLVDNFRTPSLFMERAILESQLQETQTHFRLFSYRQCVEFLTFNATAEARAALMTLVELDRNSWIPLKWWEALGVETELPVWGFKQALQDVFDRIDESLIAGGEWTFNDVLMYMGYGLRAGSTYFGLEDVCDMNKMDDEVKPSPMCANVSHYGQSCCDLEKVSLKSFRDIVNVMKLRKETKVKQMSGKKYLEDVSKMMTTVLPQEFKLKHRQQELEHPSGIFIACSFGRKTGNALSSSCPQFHPSFTTKGLGYTFNQIPFFDVVKESGWSRDFHQEVVEQVEPKSQEDPRSPEFNGPGFALKMLIRIEKAEDDLSFFAEMEEPRLGRTLAIHSPSSIPNLAGDVLELSAGTHYTVLVTPTVLKTNSDLESLTPEQRECYAKRDKGRLAVFEQYNQQNCLFECQLMEAVESCGCIPWDFPRPNSSVPVCYQGKGVDCFDREFGEFLDPTRCPDCLVDCNLVTYSYTVLTKPLKERRFCPIYYLPGAVTEIQNLTFAALSNPLESLRISLEAAGDGGVDPYEPFLTRICGEFVREHIAAVDVHVAPAMANRITRGARVTFAEQLADLGGVVALFTGMSILSLFEIVMWCIKVPKIIKESLTGDTRNIPIQSWKN